MELKEKEQIIENVGDYIEFVRYWTSMPLVQMIEKQISYIRELSEAFVSGSDFAWKKDFLDNDEDAYSRLSHRCIHYLNEALIEAKRELSLCESKSGSTDYFCYYRGQYDSRWDVMPSVFRPQYIEDESYLYHEIMVRCPDEFESLSHLDRLVKMQHYSCPTRLLDVTANPLVALYFACKNYGCQKCDAADVGKIILFRANKKQVAYADSDKVLMLSCLPRFDKSSQWELLQQVDASEKDGRFKQKQGGSSYKEPIVEQLYHEISREVPSFKREIVPMDLLKPIFVQPNRMNNRILKQDGAFIISGLCNLPGEISLRIMAMSNTSILVVNKEEILRELDSIGINEASLFPEVDKVAEYLKNKRKL